MEKQAVKIFISYAEKDKEFYDELVEFIAPMRREGSIETWDMSQVMPGDEWELTAEEELEKAQVILFLVSPSLMGNDYFHEVELKNALKRESRDEVVVVPILIRPTLVRGTPLGKFQMIPRKFQSISTSNDRDTAWHEAVISLKRVVESIQNSTIELAPKKVPPVIDSNFSYDIFEEARAKIAEGNIENALKMLLADKIVKQLDEHNGLILLYSRFNILQKDQRNGIITRGDADVGFAQVNYSLLQTINHLQEVASQYEQT